MPDHPITFRIDAETKRRLRTMAGEQDVSMVEMLRRLITVAWDARAS